MRNHLVVRSGPRQPLLQCSGPVESGRPLQVKRTKAYDGVGDLKTPNFIGKEDRHGDLCG